MFTNNFDPVAIQIFHFEIRWYSLAYIMGILIGWFLSKKIFITDTEIKEKFDDYLTFLILGIIIGGRLGYVLFYNLDYYSNSELCHLYSVIESNEFYKSLITQIDVQKNNTILITRIKNLEVNIGNLDMLEIKFENLMTFYNRIVKFKGWSFYDKVNLKYIDQIICSKK